MAGLNAVFTMGSIPQMPHVNLTGKGQILLYPLGVLEPLRLAVQALSQAKLNAPIDILHRLRLNAAVACDVTFPRRHTHLDASQSRAILAAVVLLFHHQNHLIQAIQSRPVGFQVMVQGFAKSKECYAALMLDGVAHEVTKVMLDYLC